MFNFIKRFFQKNTKDLLDENGNVIQKSALEYSQGNQRYLRLSNSSCAIVLHEDNNVEVIFTRNHDDSTITENEEELMALALFIKQPGFLEMIVDEFRKIASNKINTLTGDNNK